MYRYGLLLVLVALLDCPAWAGTTRHSLMREDANFVHVAEDGYGTALSDTSLQAAVTAIGSAAKTILLTPGVWSITSDLTIPENITLQAPPGTTIAVGIGRTLTISGPVQFPVQHIFTAAGQVVWKPGTEVYPQWWGAKGDDSTDGHLAFRRALSSLAASGGGVLRVPMGKYVLVPDLLFYVGSLTTGTRIECDPSRTSILKLGGPTELDGQARAFFQINNADDVTVRNCVFDYNGHQWKAGEALQLYWAINVEGTSQRVTIEHNEFRNNPGTQSVVLGGSGIGHVVRGNRFLNGGKDTTAGNPNNPDFTALYVQTPQALVEENFFEWDAALGDTTGARSAVEIHTHTSGVNSGTIVRGNHFIRASLGVRLECDGVGHQMTDTIVSHNVIDGAQIGIFLSSAPGVTAGQCDFRKLNIHDNQVNIKESSQLGPNITGIVGIGTSLFGGSNRPVVFASKVHHNTVELAQPHKAYTDNEIGIWFGSIYDSEISDNILVNGTVLRLSSSLFGVRGVQVRHNSFTNVVTDFASDHALMWLDFTGASVSTQGVWVDGNVFTRNPDSAPLANTFAFQVDGDPGHNVFFTNNLIRNIDEQFIGTLGSMNVFNNTRAFHGALDVLKGVSADSNGLVIMTDADPTGPLALLKMDRGSDSERLLVHIAVNGLTSFLIDPNGDASMGSNRSMTLGGANFVALGATPAGSMYYCLDCNTPSVLGETCTTDGDEAGALAIKIRGAYKCF